MQLHKEKLIILEARETRGRVIDRLDRRSHTLNEKYYEFNYWPDDCRPELRARAEEGLTPPICLSHILYHLRRQLTLIGAIPGLDIPLMTRNELYIGMADLSPGLCNDKLGLRVASEDIGRARTLYGWTLRSSRKAEQIMANPNVSVVVEYMQIDGVASVKGRPTDEPVFLELIREKLPHRYENMVKGWSAKSDRVVIEVMPKRIALFKYPDPAAGIVQGLYVLNVDERKAYRHEYS